MARPNTTILFSDARSSASPDKFTVNSDAHVLPGRSVGLGVVIRDVQGQIVAATVRKMQVRWEVEQQK